MTNTLLCHHSDKVALDVGATPETGAAIILVQSKTLVALLTIGVISGMSATRFSRNGKASEGTSNSRLKKQVVKATRLRKSMSTRRWAYLMPKITQKLESKTPRQAVQSAHAALVLTCATMIRPSDDVSPVIHWYCGRLTRKCLHM